MNGLIGLRAGYCKSFIDICHYPSLEQKTTMKALAKIVEIKDYQNKCDLFLDQLKKHSSLILEEKSLSDLTPLMDLEFLTELFLNDNKISDITPLKHLNKLKTLRLGNNRISRIEVLREFSELEVLDLSGNHIKSIEPLKQHTKLIELFLHRNVIEDFSYLRNLKNLNLLFIEGHHHKDLSVIKSLQNLHGLAILNTPNADLSFIKGLKNLTALNISGSNLDDLTLLKGLTKLRQLVAWNNRIKDISVLKDCKDLEELYLSRNPLSDLSPLKGLAKLKILELKSTYVKDISPLSNLNKLEVLDVDLTYVYDISPLRNLTQLKEFTPSRKLFKSIKPLTKLKNLQKLDLFDKNLENYDFLKQLTQLKELTLSKNWSSDLSALSGLIHLEKLELNSMNLKDISQLSGLRKLKSLKISNNKIADISVLKGLSKLENLNLAGNPIHDFSPIAELKQLKKLNLSNTRIRNIAPLKELILLQKLTLGWNQIDDLTPISGLTGLRKLFLRDNQISNIKPLQNLTRLVALSLDENRIRDITPLKNLQKLSTLELDENKIADISPLRELINLTELDVSENNIRNIKPLSSLVGLTKLDIQDNPIHDCRAIWSHPNYESYSAADFCHRLGRSENNNTGCFLGWLKIFFGKSKPANQFERARSFNIQGLALIIKGENVKTAFWIKGKLAHPVELKFGGKRVNLSEETYIEAVKKKNSQTKRIYMISLSKDTKITIGERVLKLAANQPIELSNNETIKSGFLAKNQTLMINNDNVSFKAIKTKYDSPVKWHRNGEVHSFELAEDLHLSLPKTNDRLKIAANSTVAFHDNGYLHAVRFKNERVSFRIAGRTVHFFGNSGFSFDEDGNVSRGLLKYDQSIKNDNNELSYCCHMSFYPNGIIRQGTLSKNQLYNHNGKEISLKAAGINMSYKDNDIFFYPNGDLKKVYLNEELELRAFGKKLTLLAGQKIEFNQNGSLKVKNDYNPLRYFNYRFKEPPFDTNESFGKCYVLNRECEIPETKVEYYFSEELFSESGKLLKDSIITVGTNKFPFRINGTTYHKNDKWLWSGVLQMDSFVTIGKNKILFLAGHSRQSIFKRRIHFYRNGFIESGPVAEDQEMIVGTQKIKFKKLIPRSGLGTLFYPDGSIICGLLFRDIRLKVGGKSILFIATWNRTKIKKFYPADISFFPNGSIREGYLGEDMEFELSNRNFGSYLYGSKVKLKKGQLVKFNKKGEIDMYEDYLGYIDIMDYKTYTSKIKGR